jgi:DNA-binding transcriptional LysR family regulator
MKRKPILAKLALLKTLGDVDIRLLRVFVVVSQCNGIAASEFELNIGKSTISRHISDLEARLGLRLCNRGPSGFSLTAEGRQVIDLTSKLLKRIDEFQSGVDAIQSTLTGTLRIGIYDPSSSNSNVNIHAAISKFDDIAPNVSLDMSMETLTALEAGVANGSIDLAIAPLYQPSPMLKYIALYEENMSLYCGSGHHLFGMKTELLDPYETLSPHKYAGYSFNSPNMRAGNDLLLERAAHVKEEESLALLIQSGRYLGFLGDNSAKSMGGSSVFWPLFKNRVAYRVQFAAIVRKRPEPDRKTQAFLECLIAAHPSKDLVKKV